MKSISKILLGEKPGMSCHWLANAFGQNACYMPVTGKSRELDMHDT